MTKLDTKAVALASGIVWSSAVLFVGIANLIQPRYGREFLGMVSSVYPGYRARPRAANVAVGAAYALADGAAAGAICAWLYNRFSSRLEKVRRPVAA